MADNDNIPKVDRSGNTMLVPLGMAAVFIVLAVFDDDAHRRDGSHTVAATRRIPIEIELTAWPKRSPCPCSPPSIGHT